MNKYSLIDVLSGVVEIDENTTYKLDGIQIPMIQRDYAQGRKDEFEIRNRFLKAIFDALEEDRLLELDFIYGAIKRIDSKYIFIPLDGQQRLSTLFLLYWYIGNRELKDSPLLFLRSTLKRFSYDTRITARKFCDRLVSITNYDYKSSPADFVSNAAWFYGSYKNDPTVKAMLVMLDEIHYRYTNNGTKELYQRLSNLSFYILPLGGFNLSDELYIKMNARGKQLTDFENFKADLVNWMQDIKNPYHSDFHTRATAAGRTMPYYLSFATKLDNAWTDFFWNFIKPADKSKVVDASASDLLFTRFFYRYLFNICAINSSWSGDTFQRLTNETKYYGFDVFLPIFKRDVIHNIESILDSLSQNWRSISKCIQPAWPNKLNLFDTNISQSQRVIFLAMCLFMEQFEYDETKFGQWMRIVWNIVENTDINDVTSMIASMKLISELSKNAYGIYEYLAKNKTLSLSSKEAIEEERTKALFICQDAEWENIFIKVESHQFFKGSVGFIISPGMSKGDFTRRAELAFGVFNERGINSKYRAEHIFLRSLISQFDNHEQIIGKNFTDQDESEHYLKKMLATNRVTRHCILKWFSVADEQALEMELRNTILSNSKMNSWDVNDSNAQGRIRKAHEALYMQPDLQQWMQQHGAIRIGWRDNHIFVSRHSAWYDWVMLDTNRNELINELVNSFNYLTEQQCQYSNDGQDIRIPYFWGNNNIVLRKTHKGFEVQCVFSKSDFIHLSIYKQTQQPLLEIKFPIGKISSANQIEQEVIDFVTGGGETVPSA